MRRIFPSYFRQNTFVDEERDQYPAYYIQGRLLGAISGLRPFGQLAVSSALSGKMRRSGWELISLAGIVIFPEPESATLLRRGRIWARTQFQFCADKHLRLPVLGTKSIQSV